MSELLLLTPGPLTTSETVKRAMLRDWGSRDEDFVRLNARVRARLLELGGAGATHACVPIAGSGTTVVEAAVATLVPPRARLLVACNGAYGRRIADICTRLGRGAVTADFPEEAPVDAAVLDRRLAADSDLWGVALVHCETTAGVLNPLEAVARVVHAHRRRLVVDAMSSFGALPFDASQVPFDALTASSNKCLQGVPGLAFALVRTSLLTQPRDRPPPLTLDLAEQWRTMETSGQWRFTPPTHVLAALDRALDELAEEGGPPARLARYQGNCERLIEGMGRLGFRPLVAPPHQAPIIVTFRMPADPRFDFARFYAEMSERGFVIYPGKLTRTASFRIGCIGHLPPDAMERAVEAARSALAAMEVESGSPE